MLGLRVNKMLVPQAKPMQQQIRKMNTYPYCDSGSFGTDDVTQVYVSSSSKLHSRTHPCLCFVFADVVLNSIPMSGAGMWSTESNCSLDLLSMHAVRLCTPLLLCQVTCSRVSVRSQPLLTPLQPLLACNSVENSHCVPDETCH